MIVVDGRTDEEKLRELLATGAEETCLDFKSTLDLSEKKHALELVKDCVAMGNLPRGGYIVVGVGDDGKAAHGQPPVDPSKFDSADLRARVAAWVEAPVRIVSQKHEVDGRVVVLIYIEPNADGLPVPFAKTCQYARGDGRGMHTVFSEGTFVIREGTSNVAFRFSHWNEILARYRERIREESRAGIDALVAQVVTALQVTEAPATDDDARDAKPPAPAVKVAPLVVGMGWDSLEEALLTHLESQSTLRIQRFLESALRIVIANFPGIDKPAEDQTPTDTPESDAGTTDARSRESGFAYENALDAIAVVAINAARYQRADIYNLAIDTLSSAYEAGGKAPTLNVGDVGTNRPSTLHWLQVVQRVMAIGRYTVAARRWALLPRLVERPVPVMSDYAYETWIRHAHVAGSRTGLLGAAVGKEHEGAALLSWTRQSLAERPQLRPDLVNPTAFTHGDLQHDDQLLDALAQFDLWWCVMAQTRASRGFGRAFYPSCAALHQYRCQPSIDTIATDAGARGEVFGSKSLKVVARSLAQVVGTAARESWNYGGFWNGIEEGTPAYDFIVANVPDS
jgi:hypothetical protein